MLDWLRCKAWVRHIRFASLAPRSQICRRFREVSGKTLPIIRIHHSETISASCCPPPFRSDVTHPLSTSGSGGKSIPRSSRRPWRYLTLLEHLGTTAPYTAPFTEFHTMQSKANCITATCNLTRYIRSAVVRDGVAKLMLHSRCAQICPIPRVSCEKATPFLIHWKWEHSVFSYISKMSTRLNVRYGDSNWLHKNLHASSDGLAKIGQSKGGSSHKQACYIMPAILDIWGSNRLSLHHNTYKWF